MPTAKQYVVTPRIGIDSLKAVDVDIPEPGPRQVLVRMRAASLNYRDLMIARGGYPGLDAASDVNPLSDGAGEVVAVGAGCTRFKPGDRVSGIFMQRWRSGVMLDSYPSSGLGAVEPGVLAEYRLFDQGGLVAIPHYLSYAQAATLPCAAVTAWNALFGGTPLLPGQTVLILGTGGVSIFALQLATAAGARVIITSSSDAKLEHAKRLGAHDGINYRKHEEWQHEVMRLTGGAGADRVIETGGAGTLQRSLTSVRREGSVQLIGVLTQGQIDPMVVLGRSIVLRGLSVGSRDMFEALNRAITISELAPVIDRTFAFAEAKEAYRYLESAQHLGKIVITID